MKTKVTDQANTSVNKEGYTPMIKLTNTNSNSRCKSNSRAKYQLEYAINIGGQLVYRAIPFGKLTPDERKLIKLSIDGAYDQSDDSVIGFSDDKTFGDVITRNREIGNVEDLIAIANRSGVDKPLNIIENHLGRKTDYAALRAELSRLHASLIGARIYALIRHVACTAATPEESCIRSHLVNLQVLESIIIKQLATWRTLRKNSSFVQHSN